tara:strand:+ start:126 stop:494 length:369 start_codon:yes stop_codon:yes gene_type:complete
MATLTVKLSLVSTNATSDSLNISVTDTVTSANDVVQKRVVTSTTATKFLEADDFTNKCYVYLKNLSTTTDEIIYIRSGATDSANLHDLHPGEFVFFSWSAVEDLNYDAYSGTPVLEVYAFEA